MNSLQVLSVQLSELFLSFFNLILSLLHLVDKIGDLGLLLDVLGPLSLYLLRLDGTLDVQHSDLGKLLVHLAHHIYLSLAFLVGSIGHLLPDDV